jgi:hypothetical protein
LKERLLRSTLPLSGWEVTMRLLVTGALLGAMLTATSAQTIMDGSGADLDQELVRNILEEVSSQFVDPYSTQFTNLRPWRTDAGSICGLVNAKNRAGGYVGFQPFRYIIEQRRAYIHSTTGCK